MATKQPEFGVSGSRKGTLRAIRHEAYRTATSTKLRPHTTPLTDDDEQGTLSTALVWNLPVYITSSDHYPASAKSRRLFNRCETSSLNMAISVLFLTIARTVSSLKRVIFSTCSRYLIAKSHQRHGKRKRLMMVRTQSVGLGTGTECQYRWKELLSVPGPNLAQDAISRHWLQVPLAVRPMATMICLSNAECRSEKGRDSPLGGHPPVHSTPSLSSPFH